MKIVVIGGSGLIGTKLVNKLRQHGHEVVAASPSSGVNAVTGAGLADVLVGTNVVVDVTNSPSFEDAAVLEFFEKSSRNLLAAEVIAGVGHHVALSVVGADRLPDSGYMRAKIAQEKLIKSAGMPYTLLRATQFFEFMGAIAYTVTGTNQGDFMGVPATGRQIKIRGVQIARFQDGQIVERWGSSDQLGILQKIGVNPFVAR